MCTHNDREEGAWRTAHACVTGRPCGDATDDFCAGMVGHSVRADTAGHTHHLDLHFGRARTRTYHCCTDDGIDCSLE